MQHTYEVAGMHCNSCVRTVSNRLSELEGITAVKVQLEPAEAQIHMEQHIALPTLNAALAEKGTYLLSEKEQASDTSAPTDQIQSTDWLTTYRPLLLIFGFLLGGTLLYAFSHNNWQMSKLMHSFMGGFFVVFSFFKLLDVKAFAGAFASYDPIAKVSSVYGRVYPFIELALGIAYLMHWAPTSVYLATLLLLGIGTIGVVRAVLDKRTIQCACLGTVFNLPMSQVTIIENSLMIVMSLIMLVQQVL
ncbi:MAG: heavy metal-associated domain-containing protein [Bacteroidota bacterium]